MRRDSAETAGLWAEPIKNQVPRQASDPPAEDHFEWPPKDPEQALGGLLDSTTTNENAFSAPPANTVVDQIRVPVATAVERILEGQNPGSLEKPRQNGSETPVLQPSPHTPVSTSTAPIVQECSDQEVAPMPSRRHFFISARRLIPSAPVAVALIALVEGVFIVWTMRQPIGGREGSVDLVLQNEAGKAAVTFSTTRACRSGERHAGQCRFCCGDFVS